MANAKLALPKSGGETGALGRLVEGTMGGSLSAAADGTLYVRLARARDGAEFVLRISRDKWHPILPPSYGFVDPATLRDGGPGCWPDDGQQAFKTQCDPPWICMPGTAEYEDHHTRYWFDSARDSICQTVMHIFSRINGAGGVGGGAGAPQ